MADWGLLALLSRSTGSLPTTRLSPGPGDAMSELYRFAAFISHSNKDAPFARRLHRALELRHSVPRVIHQNGGGNYEFRPMGRCNWPRLSPGHFLPTVASTLGLYVVVGGAYFGGACD